MTESIASLATCKRVETFNADGTHNGYLVELAKDGEKTTVYLTVTKPGAFKGYHLHQRRTSNFVLLKGKLKVIVVNGKQKEEILLDENSLQRLTVPTNVYTALENVGNEDAWLINIPVPPYDPHDRDEQLEKTALEIAQQLEEK